MKSVPLIVRILVHANVRKGKDVLRVNGLAWKSYPCNVHAGDISTATCAYDKCEYDQVMQRQKTCKKYIDCKDAHKEDGNNFIT
ncbi:hypothetical protein PMAYCL1PPCAC_26757, partial [Pristionchus mayeri]